MRLQHGKRNKEDHSVCVIIRPQNLPQTEHILERELTLERDKDPTARDSVNDTENSSSNGTHRKQKNKFNPSVFSKCRYSSGSMNCRSCWRVDSCFFIPLWSRRKFCFYQVQMHLIAPRIECKRHYIPCDSSPLRSTKMSMAHPSQ